ncbi:MAG: hypothetical protein H0T73_14090 [Ardenticatenales bacterium]|nr:hypothetical protein [Ardenticatenales bacterium]
MRYECIYRFFVTSQATCCWLRVCQDTTGQLVVLLGEVPGNPGPSVRSAIESLIAQLSEHFALDPARVRWVIWEATPVQEPQLLQIGGQPWSVLPTTEVQIGALRPTRPFWRNVVRGRDTLRQEAWVGRRRAEIWQELGLWHALVQGRRDEFTRRSPIPCATRPQAQQWALQHLASLAQEFDELPRWSH